MLKRSPFRLALAITGLLTCGSSSAQIPGNILERVFKIRIEPGTVGSAPSICSGFTMNVDGRPYLITARHCLKDRSQLDRIKVWQGKVWTNLKGARLILPSNEMVDIAALDVPGARESKGSLESGTGDVAPSFGAAVYFIGYPFGGSGGGRFQGGGEMEFPFIKAGVLSAVDARQADAVRYFVDGHNNPGFSGGPIVFRWESRFRVVAVVSGYPGEPVPVVKERDLPNLVAPAHDGLYIRANTGIVVGYGIHHIVNAIRAAQGGPFTPTARVPQ